MLEQLRTVLILRPQNNSQSFLWKTIASEFSKPVQNCYLWKFHFVKHLRCVDPVPTTKNTMYPGYTLSSGTLLWVFRWHTNLPCQPVAGSPVKVCLRSAQQGVMAEKRTQLGNTRLSAGGPGPGGTTHSFHQNCREHCVICHTLYGWILIAHTTKIGNMHQLFGGIFSSKRLSWTCVLDKSSVGFKRWARVDSLWSQCVRYQPNSYIASFYPLFGFGFRKRHFGRAFLSKTNWPSWLLTLDNWNNHNRDVPRWGGDQHQSKNSVCGHWMCGWMCHDSTNRPHENDTGRASADLLCVPFLFKLQKPSQFIAACWTTSQKRCAAPSEAPVCPPHKKHKTFTSSFVLGVPTPRKPSGRSVLITLSVVSFSRMVTGACYSRMWWSQWVSTSEIVSFALGAAVGSLFDRLGRLFEMHSWNLNWEEKTEINNALVAFVWSSNLSHVVDLRVFSPIFVTNISWCEAKQRRDLGREKKISIAQLSLTQSPDAYQEIRKMLHKIPNLNVTFSLISSTLIKRQLSGNFTKIFWINGEPSVLRLAAF